jgi:hypothetical protein
LNTGVAFGTLKLSKDATNKTINADLFEDKESSVVDIYCSACILEFVDLNL